MHAVSPPLNGATPTKMSVQGANEDTYYLLQGTYSSLESGTERNLQTYKRRWFVLGVFMSHMISNNVVWITFSPISTLAQCYYGVSLFWINALSWVYMLTYVLFSIPAVWFLEKGGLKWTALIAGTLNTAGSWLRFAGTRNSFTFSRVCVYTRTNSNSVVRVWVMEIFKIMSHEALTFCMGMYCHNL